MAHLLRPSIRRLLLLGGAVAAATLVSATISIASSPFVAGQPSTHELTLPADASARGLQRAAGVARALGLPVGAQSIQRLDDRFDHATYDEITTSDDRGRPTSIVRFSPDGRLSLAVGLGLHDAGAPTDVAGAIRQAELVAGRAGIETAGAARPAASRIASGWAVTWPRIADGALVRGDGVRVVLWSDGAFHSVGRTERPLAPRPAMLAGEAQARSASATFVGARFGPAAGWLEPVSATLGWVAPNDTWDASRPDAPDAVARLAWIVEYRATGPLAGRLTAIEVWLDAGSLALIGGDVAE